MLDCEIINHMDVDELRNYIFHQQTVMSALRNINSDNAEIIEHMQRASYLLISRDSTLGFYNARQGELTWVEKELMFKYAEYLPKYDSPCDDGNPRTNCKEGQG